MSAQNTSTAAVRTDVPKKGFAGFKENWKADLLAGFTVSLIALPLCLGIAKASEFPPIAGLFTAIVGGLFASRLAGSNVTISGPAAGLIVINVAAVASLGGTEKGPLGYAVGYPYALAAILVGGLFVVLFGLLKVGKLSDFFPSAAVHGMLAAIGIIIIIKQLFDGIGVKPAKTSELYELIAQIPQGLKLINPLILLVSGISLAILIAYPFIKNKYFRLIPAPMWVLLVTVPIGYFALHLGDIAQMPQVGNAALIDAKAVVSLPKNVADGIVLPDFGKFGTGAFWMAVLSIALVSGLESLLSAKAVDALDPWKRKSEMNRDLIAMGGGSALAAAIGGLPMISEIVRSSANINNGARSQWANFFHGGFLLIFLLLLAPVINMIPVAALAGMLIFTGFRLASPKEFKHMFEIAWTQLLVFIITIVVVIAVDLLVGIFAGIIAEFVVNLASGGKLRSLFVARGETEINGETARIKLRDSLTFSNYLSLKSKINKAQAQATTILLDMSDVNYIDHTVMANLTSLQADLRMQNKQLKLENLEKLSPVTSHALSPRKLRVAGTSSPTPNLSSRQLGMLVFAIDRHLDFLPLEWEEHDRWAIFPSVVGQKIERVANVFVKKGQGFRLTIADLKMGLGALLTYESSEATYMRINLRNKRIPVYNLTKESSMDKVAAALGVQDIDFDQFPDFSNTFLLQGNDEQAIRSFFTEELLHFHEANPDYFVESAGDALLVYKMGNLASADEIEHMLEYGKKLSQMLLGEPVEAPQQIEQQSH